MPVWTKMRQPEDPGGDCRGPVHRQNSKGKTAVTIRVASECGVLMASSRTGPADMITGSDDPMIQQGLST